MNAVTTALLGLALVVFILYRQCVRRPVTRRDLWLPAIGALYLTSRYLNGDVKVSDAVIVLIGAAIGIGTGLVSGQVIHIWRDDASGLVYQFGGWRYALVVVALIGVRGLMRVVAQKSGVVASAAVLNDAFIAMLVGNLLGRAINVGTRSLALVGWDYSALPRRRDLRERRRHSRRYHV